MWPKRSCPFSHDDNSMDLSLRPLLLSDSRRLIAPLFCPATPDNNFITLDLRALSLHSLFHPTTTLQLSTQRLSPCAPSSAWRRFCNSQFDGSFLTLLFYLAALDVSLRPLFRPTMTLQLSIRQLFPCTLFPPDGYRRLLAPFFHPMAPYSGLHLCVWPDNSQPAFLAGV
jgi:hypothetical protein